MPEHVLFYFVFLSQVLLISLLFSKNSPMAIEAETGFENSWLWFDRYLDAVTQVCYDRTAEQ